MVELLVEGFEMLKGLAACERRNSRDYAALSRMVRARMALKPEVHRFLVRRQGLFTWGRDAAEARRHVEVFEFLFEVLGRTEGRVT
jgi:methylthioribulose-1-phosphate dehydratase